MIDIGVGLSLGKNATAAAEEATRIAKINKTNKEKIDLALVFSSTGLSAAGLSKTLNSLLSGIPIIGSTGAAIISNQGVFENGLVLMLLSFPKGIYFSTAYTKDIKTKNAISSGEELGEKLLYGFKNLPRNLSLIFLDRLIEDSSNFIYGLQERLGQSFPFLGVSASDTAQSLKTSLYFNQGIINDGCAGILWGGRLAFGLGIKHGWKPLGKPHTVTASSGNIVETIDGEPAVKLYEEYLACDIPKLKKDLKHFSIFYPIGVFIEGEQEYLLRNIINIEEDGSLVCQGNIPQTSTIRLMISTKETCLNATYQAIDEAKKNLSSQVIKFSKEKTSSLAIVFSSISRYTLLRREAKRELEIIKENLLPDTPIIGLYTYGALAPLKASSYRGRAYFHNQTISVLIIEG
jgi:hypothetical protein